MKNYINSIEIKQTEELMVLVGEKSSQHIEELISFLNEKGIKFFGGIYSRLLVEEHSHAEGFIIQKYEPIYSSIVLPNLMRFKLDINQIKGSTAIVLIDGLSDKMQTLTDTVFNKLGDAVKYIGGGAGFYDLEHRPCIFNNQGVHRDVLHICIVKEKVEVAVRHGWNKMEGPFTVTEARDNIVSKIDNYMAFDVYRDVIEEHEGIILYKEDFFTYAKEHPFGVVKNGQMELIVRDPIAINENDEIVCVAGVPENSELYVLKGNVDTLLNSSLQIAEYCSAKAPDKYKPLLFNCISRAMYMENRFEEELSNIQSKLKYPVEGALSIGEISSQKNGELVIHNKSTILGLLSE